MYHFDVFASPLTLEQQRIAADSITTVAAKALNLDSEQKESVSIRFKMHRSNDAIGGKLRAERKDNNDVSIQVSGPVNEQQERALATGLSQATKGWSFASPNQVRTFFYACTTANKDRVLTTAGR